MPPPFVPVRGTDRPGNSGSVGTVRAEDVALLTTPVELAFHRDLLLVAVNTPDLDGNDYRGGLRRIDPATGKAAEPTGREWTGGRLDSQPVISPDGAWLAFLRAGGGSGPAAGAQLHVMPTGGGESRRITELPLGVSDPVWAPDSRRIAFLARIPEPGRYGVPLGSEEQAPTPDAEAPRRITREDYRHDDLGFVHDRHVRLFVVDALDPAATPVELTDGGCDVSAPVWAPDGARIIVVAPRNLGAEETLEEDLYVVPARGGEIRLLISSPGNVSAPAVTQDGLVVFLGCAFTGADSAGRSRGLWVGPLDGSAPPRRLTDESVDCEGCRARPLVVVGRDVGGDVGRDVGRDVLVCVRNRGAVELRRVPLAAERSPLDRLPVVLGERAEVVAYALRDNTIAAVVGTWDSPGEVVLADHAGVRTLTDFAAPLRATGLHEPREITGTAPDGYPVHGFLVLPDGPGPHPVLLHVHGGPFFFHRWRFYDEAQVYASAGYAVVLPNPRGSAGYGQDHGRAVVKAFGTVDADDLLALLDVALENPACDARRVGMMGGSYGGFMTSWLAARHGARFRAAWSERAVNAWDSFSGTSDIGSLFIAAYIGTDRETQWRHSPLRYADRIQIPFAVVHSEQDWRCPMEQAQRMFVALHRNGTEVEFLLFPGESHELSRTGRPRHRVQRFEAVLDWWSRHLKPAPGTTVP